MAPSKSACVSLSPSGPELPLRVLRTTALNYSAVLVNCKDSPGSLRSCLDVSERRLGPSSEAALENGLDPLRLGIGSAQTEVLVGLVHVVALHVRAIPLADR